MSAQTKQPECPECGLHDAGEPCLAGGPVFVAPGVVEHRIVAECWTCGEALQEKVPDRTRTENLWRIITHPWKPHTITSQHGLDLHRAAGHDVREVKA